MSKNNKGTSSPTEDEEAIGTIEPIEIQLEMERSFLEYSMSVIISRALPDVRDGLKPVHRRILYGMWDNGHRPDRPHVKCAKVVGDVMGRFHPHGDAAIYDALARMVQDFSLRHPLIDGHGNFGAPGPNAGPAAMRYTEARLSQLAMSLLEDINEQTVDFVPNYDGSDEEPVVLPGRFPNLLVNGSQGIAVGMATNIPPHNLGEVIDATKYLIDNPEATSDDLMRFVKGPDFPTGATILGRQGIIDAYRTGRGSIKLRSTAEIIEGRGGISQIVVTEIPYQASVEVIAERIADLVENGELSGISDIQDASSGGKPKLVITCKRDANPNVLLNNLYKQTPLQSSFGIHMLALVDGVPRLLNLSNALSAYIRHQIEVVTRRSEYRLNKAKARAHIVEGLLKALDILDEVIAAIRSSADRQDAKTKLMAEPFSFSDEQATHILDMTLSRLTRLGRRELEDEMAQLKALILDLESILNDDGRLRSVISEELEVIKKKFATPRKTTIGHDAGEINTEDLIDDEEVVVTLTKAGYIKAVQTDSYKTQSRGGKGVRAAKLKEEDIVEEIIHTTTHAYLLLFSNKGKVYRLRAYEVPMKERTAKGTAIVNLIPLAPEEKIEEIVATKDFDTDKFLLFVTKNGQVKKTSLTEYDKTRREGFIAINLHNDDELVRVFSIGNGEDVIMVSKNGMAIRFSEEDIRAVSRAAAGVRGMKLKEGDEVVSSLVTKDDSSLLVITLNGYGKRIKLDSFHRQARGGQGVRCIRLTQSKGYVVSGLMAEDDDEVLISSSTGILIRTSVKQITSQGRTATGVRVMNLGDDQCVAAVALVKNQDQEYE
jgi:DNA gyrase subunit A